MSDAGGVWRTVSGRRVFIKDGQSLTNAMRESGKFEHSNLQAKLKKRLLKDTDKYSEITKEFTEEEFEKAIYDTAKFKWMKPGEDELMKSIAEKNGFNEKPTVVDADKFDEMADGKSIVLYRGVSQETFSNEFKDGNYFAGKGLHGSGTYTAEGHGGIDVAYEYSGDTGTINRMMLKRNALVVKKSDLESLWSKKFGEVDKSSKEYKLNSNRGRFAALEGYDAIFVEDKGYYVVLNRSKLVVDSNNYTKTDKNSLNERMQNIYDKK